MLRSIFGKGRLAAAAAAVAAVALAGPAHAQDITGAGATFPYPVYAKWADAYKKEAGIGLNYQSIGSGAGMRQIRSKTVTFGASDAPLTAEQLKKDGLVQWPMVMGAIVLVVNIDGLKSNELVLDGPTVSRIYLGQIKTWDDPAIRKLNPNVKLRSAGIQVVRRSDGSGTTFVFTDYLSKVSADWKGKIGSGTAVEWPVGVGARGNEGVAGNVRQTKNSIGYVEYAYAKQNNLTYASMINAAGKRVNAGVPSFQAAAANADWAGTPGFRVILTQQPGDASWPVTAATFILMHAKPADKKAAAAALRFFNWAFEKGDKMAEDLDYIPMPQSVVDLIKKTWAKEIETN
ncbi:MAG: phosphate ABC transporter substrate-binding protein PstS [Alphaproteobacteria bacterium]|nr:phosphate ABC transporter substrate-binding protein PstS [Alphaproteobacteria bacterium]